MNHSFLIPGAVVRLRYAVGNADVFLPSGTVVRIVGHDLSSDYVTAWKAETPQGVTFSIIDIFFEDTVSPLEQLAACAWD